jgi:hypothetical protein
MRCLSMHREIHSSIITLLWHKMSVPTIAQARSALFNERVVDIRSFYWLSTYFGHGLGLDTPPVESLLHRIPFNFREAHNTTRLQLFRSLGLLVLATINEKLAALEPVTLLSGPEPRDVDTDRETIGIGRPLDANEFANEKSTTIAFKKGWAHESVKVEFSGEGLELSTYDSIDLRKIVSHVYRFSEHGQLGLFMSVGDQTDSFRIDLRTSRIFITRALDNFCNSTADRRAFGVPPCTACQALTRDRRPCICGEVYFCNLDCLRESIPKHRPVCKFVLAHQNDVQLFPPE